MIMHPIIFFFFFFNDTATTEIYTLSLHDALPISMVLSKPSRFVEAEPPGKQNGKAVETKEDRKSTRLNSSHLVISYAVFCLKKKKNTITIMYHHYLIILVIIVHYITDTVC